jgi:hypothetical protein
MNDAKTPNPPREETPCGALSRLLNARGASAGPSDGTRCPTRSKNKPRGPRPVWEAKTGELWWKGKCIKCYRNDAANQRQVLDAFEEQGWPSRIDDPLPREPGVNAKDRLRETIKGLNRSQSPRQLWFRGDGTALGIRWEPVE